MIRTIIAIALLQIALGSVSTFRGHRVVRVVPNTDVQLNLLHDLELERADLDFWQPASEPGSAVDIRVQPEDYDDLVSFLSSHQLKSELFIEDVQAVIDDVNVINQAKGFSCDEKYLRYEAMAQWLKDTAQQYSSIARLVEVGKTYEGRTIYGIEINGNSKNASSEKPGFFMDGGIHAREWISPGVVRYLLNYVLSNYGSNDDVTNVVDTYQMTFVPLFNIDGYEYTHTNNRLWRKTRKPNSGSSCIGTDPNRNAAANHCGTGASTSPCSDIYCGPSPFSEPAVAAVKDYVLALGNVRIYFNMHSYSQLLLAPYGYTRDRPADYNLHQQAGQASVQAIRNVHGKVYRHGPTATTIYMASGGIADYLYDQGIPHSYVYELRDTGRYGFLLPPTEICANSEEIWAGLMALFEIDTKGAIKASRA